MFGEKCNYLKMFNEAIEMRQMDISKDDEDVDNYISEGIKGYQKECETNLVEILSDREIFKKLILYLKENCNIKYSEIMNYFEIPRGTIDSLKSY